MSDGHPKSPIGIGVCRNQVELYVWTDRPQPICRYLEPGRARRIAEALLKAAECAEQGVPLPPA